ncbi:MAG TPA: copper resistance protein B [Acidisarcina sp.]
MGIALSLDVSHGGRNVPYGGGVVISRGKKRQFSTRVALSILFAGLAIFLSLLALASEARAQSGTAPSANAVSTDRHGWKPPITDRVVAHVLFNQLEGRTDGASPDLRWDGEGWIGTDMNRLWIKSEGTLHGSSLSDGDQELLYDRPIPRLRYLDAQVGIREDLDSSANRTWGAIGIEGLAPSFFQIEPTFYFRDGGHVAGKITASYDLRITQRLVAQPELEMNFYSKPDPARGLGTGMTDLDTGIRLRYEIRRKVAPYVGLAYTDQYGSTASYSHRSGDSVSNPRFIFGIRVWH